MLVKKVWPLPVYTVSIGYLIWLSHFINVPTAVNRHHLLMNISIYYILSIEDHSGLSIIKSIPF